MAARYEGARFLHMVQTDREKAYVEGLGGEVVMSLESIVREALRGDGPGWIEPEDFRAVTDYPWSPIASDRYLPSFDPAVQSRIARAIYDGIASVFAANRIDAFLSEPVALFVTHCAFYLSRKHGARPMMWANPWFPGWLYFVDGIHISRPVRRTEMAAAERAEMAGEVRAYFEGVVADLRGPAYHPSFLERRLSSFSVFKQRRGQEPLVVQPGLVSRTIQRLRLLRVLFYRSVFPRLGDFMTAGAVQEHRTYLRSLTTKASIYDEPPQTLDPMNVVYPLQYEPEASLLYFAPDFRDQPVLVENALRALPSGATLWVKEHPNQFGALGSPTWLSLKRKYGALRFVHGRQSGRNLIRNSGLVLTVTSSAGMDALAIGRKVIVVGEVYYRCWPGTIPVNSVAGLAAALNDPENYRPVSHCAELIDKLVAIGTQCYPGDPQPRHELYSCENLDRLVFALDAELSAGAAG